MAPEYELPDNKFDEVRYYLLTNGVKPVASSNNIRITISVLELDGEPIVIQNNGLIRTKRTIRISKETADRLGEAGITLKSVRKKAH